MRALISLYLTIGVVLLVLGFFATGDCPDKNTDVVSDVVFVLGWPVYLYDDVVHGNLTALEAVVGDVRRRGIDRVVHGGDLALMGPRPAEVIDRTHAPQGKRPEPFGEDKAVSAQLNGAMAGIRCHCPGKDRKADRGEKDAEKKRDLSCANAYQGKTYHEQRRANDDHEEHLQAHRRRPPPG